MNKIEAQVEAGADQQGARVREWFDTTTPAVRAQWFRFTGQAFKSPSLEWISHLAFAKLMDLERERTNRILEAGEEEDRRMDALAQAKEGADSARCEADRLIEVAKLERKRMRYARKAWIVAAVVMALAVIGVEVARGQPAMPDPPGPPGGWTALAPEASSRVIYVSAAGADSNTGLSEAVPVRTLARAWALVRDGFPDWIMLRAGDTWNESFPNLNKSAGSSTRFMVITSYGAGPRPKLRTTSPAFYGGGSTIRRGLAIVDLDLAAATPGSGYAGITFLESWGHVLIENCSIVGYPVNIVAQETGSGRLPDIRIRGCVIADSKETGQGHSQGLFMGSCDDWVVEGCIFDLNAADKHDMFCHNAYIHETNGPGVFRDNISARACSHGVQQRPGGLLERCLFLQNPINAYQGKSASDHPAPVNRFRLNVALDSRDINAIDKRGMGFVIGGADFTEVEGNVAAHQRMGSEAVTAFSLDGIRAARVWDNIVYDWTAPGHQGWATAYQWDGGSGAVVFENNAAWMPFNGMCIRHESRVLSPAFTYRMNRYYTTNPATGYEAFSSSGGVGGDWNWWRARAGEKGSTFANPGAFDVSIAAYMASLGASGGVPEFMAQARQQSRQNWRTQYTAAAVTGWVRCRLGMPGACAGPSCYADQDGNGDLNANDFQVFANKFAAGELSANCDGSTVEPIENANDFQCFLNSYAAGCP